MKTILTLALACLALTASTACDNGTGPAAPTQIRTPPTPRVPQVAGTYRGSLTLTASVGSVYAGEMTARVTQAGTSVTLTGTYTTPDGTRAGLPAITGRINESGYFTATEGGGTSETAYEPTCGTWHFTGSRISFSGGTMSYWGSYDTTYCGQIQMSGTLRR